MNDFLLPLLFQILYLAASAWLALYSINSLYLLWLYHRPHTPAIPPPEPENLPIVTVQLPLYNEVYMVTRLMRSVAGLDYPRERLEIQVLDDSSDDTWQVAAAEVARLRQAGYNISHLRRAVREGFKAGALAHGTRIASGEFIAIFDADFLPPPDFLRRTIPWFQDPALGCLQARWTHINRDTSLLTRLQALAIDAHFMVEQTARSRAGLFMNFNGSAGVWRRACIEDAGGWRADTLTEDFELSYRAQLKGWRFAYLPTITVPAELPAQMAAFKRQQARWARGSLQTARLHLGSILRARLPWRVRIQAVFHLTHYLVHPLILLVLLLSFPMQWMPLPAIAWLPLLMLTALGPPLLYLTAPAPEAPGWRQRLALVPGLMLMGVGVSFKNALAALAGLFLPQTGAFERTPKFDLRAGWRDWRGSRYALRGDPILWAELLLVLLVLLGLLFAWQAGNWGFIPWLLFYAAGYGYIAFTSLAQLRAGKVVAVASPPYRLD